MLRPGALVVDVGVNVVPGGIVGDVDFASAREVAGAITPVPGGLGPVTNAILLQQVMRAARDLARGPGRRSLRTVARRPLRHAVAR
jgi:5,10-methylene-tetrahydrofolate dehydrogenase/methenyl tetrahydrofolate cyclohydrolase